MAISRARYWRSLIAIAVLIGGLWGGGIALHAARASDAEKEDAQRPGLVNLGLDLQGGISVVLGPAPGQDVADGALEKARDIIAQRVDGLGVAEPDIAIEGSNIAVQLPGLTKARQALDLIGTTAQLSFRPVLAQVQRPAEGGEAEEPLPDCGDPATFPDAGPEEEVVLCEKPDADEQVPEERWPLLRLGPVALLGDDVSSATATPPDFAGGSPSWSVTLNLTRQGGQKFKEITGELAQKGGDERRLAIVLDNVVESSPQIGQEVGPEGIGGGTAVITGDFTESEARDLSLILRYGALPLELEAQTTTTVSPTLGRDSLRGGLLAGAIGVAILFLYVLLFYRGLGLVIWVGLAVHGAFTLGFVVLLGQTVGFALTLAGIAGLIVSLGISTDSFIVYFERIKDEVREGKTVRASVDRAWASAWRTILAADLVTALAAVVLYMLAVGSVRGFALMLGIATALDVFVSRLYMHPVVWLLAQTKMMNRSKTFGMGAVAGIGEPIVEPGGGA